MIISFELTRYALSIQSIIIWTNFVIEKVSSDFKFEYIFKGMNKFIFAYSCLTNFLSVAEALKNPSKKNLTFILVMTFLSQFVVVMAIGLMSYL